MAIPTDELALWKMDDLNVDSTTEEVSGLDLTFIHSGGGSILLNEVDQKLDSGCIDVNLGGLSTPASAHQFSNTQATVTMWVKLDDLDNANLFSNNAFSGTSGSTDNNGTRALFLASHNKFEFRHAVQTAEQSTDSNGYNAGVVTELRAISTTTPSNGVWYFLAHTLDTNTTSLYLNGVKESSVTSTASAVVKSTSSLADQTFCIGAQYYPGQAQVKTPMQGLVDQVRVFDRVLTDQEILDLYNETDAVVPSSGAIVGTIGTPIGNFNWWAVSAPTAIPNPDDFWTMTALDGSGDLPPDVVGGVTLLKSGTPTLATGVGSPFGSALRLDAGDGMYYDLPDELRFQREVTSMSVWFRVDSVGGVRQVIISDMVQSSGTAGERAGLQLRLNLVDGIEAFYRIPNDETTTDSNGNSQTSYSPIAIGTTSIQPNTWYHAAVVLSGPTTGSTLKLYVNGVLESTVSSVQRVNMNTVPDSGYQSYCLGKQYYPSINGSYSPMQGGYIDQVRHYQSEITDEEVLALYNEGVAV